MPGCRKCGRQYASAGKYLKNHERGCSGQVSDSAFAASAGPSTGSAANSANERKRGAPSGPSPQAGYEWTPDQSVLGQPPLKCTRVAEPDLGKKAIDAYSAFLFSEELSDIWFEVKRGGNASSSVVRIPAHRFVLAARSPYWRTMLFGATASSSREATEGVIRPGCSEAAMCTILRHVYTFGTASCLAVQTADSPSPVSLALRVVLEVAQLCLPYELPELRAGCETFQSEHVLEAANACETLEAAIEFGMPILVERAEEFILDNADAVFDRDQEGFLTLRPSSLCQFAHDERLNLSSEFELFMACNKYAQHHSQEDTNEGRRQVVADALSGIRFRDVSAKEFSTQVVPTGLIAEEHYLPCLLYLSSEGESGEILGPTKPRVPVQFDRSLTRTILCRMVLADGKECSTQYGVTVKKGATFRAFKQQLSTLTRIPAENLRCASTSDGRFFDLFEDRDTVEPIGEIDIIYAYEVEATPPRVTVKKEKQEEEPELFRTFSVYQRKMEVTRPYYGNPYDTPGTFGLPMMISLRTDREYTYRELAEIIYNRMARFITIPFEDIWTWDANAGQGGDVVDSVPFHIIAVDQTGRRILDEYKDNGEPLVIDPRHELLAVHWTEQGFKGSNSIYNKADNEVNRHHTHPSVAKK